MKNKVSIQLFSTRVFDLHGSPHVGFIQSWGLVWWGIVPVFLEFNDWNWRTKFPSMSGHLGFTFCPAKWLGASIPDMEIEFTEWQSLTSKYQLLLIVDGQSNFMAQIPIHLSFHSKNSWISRAIIWLNNCQSEIKCNKRRKIPFHKKVTKFIPIW